MYWWAGLGFAGAVEERWGCAWDEIYFHGISIQFCRNVAIVLWFWWAVLLSVLLCFDWLIGAGLQEEFVDQGHYSLVSVSSLLAMKASFIFSISWLFIYLLLLLLDTTVRGSGYSLLGLQLVYNAPANVIRPFLLHVSKIHFVRLY